MMRTLGKILVVVAVAALALPALAQRGPGFGMFGGGGIGQLATNKSVQKELKLTDDQVKKIDTAIKEIREKHQDDFAKLRDLDQSERFEKMRELQKTVSEEQSKELKTILDEKQMKRLKQIALQQRGPMAFADEEIQKELKLTDDQKDKIKTINDDAMQEMREAGQNAFNPDATDEEKKAAFKKLNEKRQEINKETMKKIDAVLTDEQKKSWKDMVGEKFEVKFEFGGRGKGEKKAAPAEKDK
jgi:Spy/CpxP family protein refolding chaperone